MEKINMERITPTDPESQSKDLVTENIEKLKQLFPEIVADGKVNLEVLQELLGEEVEDEQQRYQFTWPGKANARREAQKPSRGTLRPAKEESVDWDNTENLFIEGDNLEVLKILQKSYHNKVKMIYIDPPYNRGNEFVYKDDYRDNLANYLKVTKQKSEEGESLSTNTESEGRYHSNWLNMMYPRLKLARNVLREDGVIFISIDDHELENLFKICNEIFGEDNFVANLTWKKKTGSGSQVEKVFAEHEYVLIYCKNKEMSSKWRYFSGSDGTFKNPDNDERGNWESCALTAPSKNRNPSQLYQIEVYPKENNAIKNNNDNILDKFEYGEKVIIFRKVDKGSEFKEEYDSNTGVAKFIRRWAYVPSSMKNIFKEGRVFLKGKNLPRYKKFEYEYEGKALRSIFFNEFSTQQGTDELRELFDGKEIVEYPKPMRLLKLLISAVTEEDDTVVDFFAGASSTAHATIEVNKESGLHRKYIMVQLPEATEEKSQARKLGFQTIAEIGAERIRRVINTNDENHSRSKNLDLGFKVFKLETSNIKAWDSDFENLEQSLWDQVHNIKEERNEEDVLYEILLKYGLDLTVPIEEHKIEGETVYNVGKGALLVCLSENITSDIAEGIGKLKDELKPETCRVLFRDNGFPDDKVKTNVSQNLKQQGIEEVRSI